MGIYLNPGNEQFAVSANSELYVDKTELIQYTNSRIGKDRPLICSSRPRRFGKTMAVTMLAAYYSKGCHSDNLFAGLKISRNEFFNTHLNKYNVIFLDIQWMYGNAHEEAKRDPSVEIVSYIQEQVIGELKKEYPECVNDMDVSLPSVLANINAATKDQFIVIIDEWDCLFREEKNNEKLHREYINMLRGLFKGTPSGAFLKLAYITGILPIKKYGTQSALNNFREHTMVSPRQMAEYVGFTETEVKALCKEHDMSFKEMQRWYDGYFFEAVGHVYSPNSVIEAIDSKEFGNYWSRTETYESLMTYIAMDFDGLRQLIVDMLGGQRCLVDVESFQNDITSFKSADDVITLLIHMGYLAYDNNAKEAFIPNEEVRSVFIRAVKNDGWDEVIRAVNSSEALLSATLAMDEKAVEQMIQEVHMQNSSSINYNNEISLSSVIALAYYSACRDYILIREMPAGNGFADMVFLPKRNSIKPALIVELKWDKTAEGAIRQIKNKKYISALKEYKGNILLVGINYDKKSRKHQCKIEKYTDNR
ncbi:MAG: ATP-binding protein [Butyrivibrio sp.]|nr:ATP-binding protein [Muribaculum sp.]MCM1551276.1 ATP-binding protein [Butyrivibrio sp.]